MDFGAALADLKLGMCVSRSGWNGPGKFLELHWYENLRPIIWLKTKTADIAGVWGASQTDLLAEDWVVVEPWQVGWARRFVMPRETKQPPAADSMANAPEFHAKVRRWKEKP